MNDREPASGELVECRLRCSSCTAAHVIALPAERPIRGALASCSCPSCGRRDVLRLAPPLPPILPPPPAFGTVRIGMYDEPNDELGDEDLVARRVRPWRT